MSNSIPKTNTSFCVADIHKTASLSRLLIDDDHAEKYTQDISNVLGMMAILEQVNTDGIAPLTNVHDMIQPLRKDCVDTDIDRTQNQAIAPNVADGLYLVPQVIE